MYVVIASLISLMQTYSSAECERDDSPGPSFSEGKGIRAWSDSVGEPNGAIPISVQRRTTGLSIGTPEDDSRNERALISLFILVLRKLKTSSFR